MDYLFQAPTITYCEMALEGLVARPWYALSNIAFLIAALSIFARGGRLAPVFGGLALLVGALSSVYDTTFTYISQLFDLTGMLVLIGYLLYRTVARITRRPRVVKYGLLAALVVGLGLIVLFRGYTGNIVFGGAVAAYIAAEIYLICTKRHVRSEVWFAAVGVFIVGCVFWLADASHAYCADAGLLNGRAVFHYTNAVVIYLLYRYYQLHEASR